MSTLPEVIESQGACWVRRDIVDKAFARLDTAQQRLNTSIERLHERIDKHRIKRDEFLVKMGQQPMADNERGDRFVRGLLAALEILEGTASAAEGGE